MKKITSVFLLAVLSQAADSVGVQFRLQTEDSPPVDAPESLRAALASARIRILNTSGEASLEFWFVSQPLSAAGKEESGASLPAVQHGSLVGLVRVGKNVNDRRGDRLPAGLYVMRLSFHPVDGAHQGIAPQRDFLVLTSPKSDSDPSAKPAFDELMRFAKHASGGGHPFSFSCWKQDGEFSPGLHTAGESDTVLHVLVGNTQLAIIIAGRYEG